MQTRQGCALASVCVCVFVYARVWVDIILIKYTRTHVCARLRTEIYVIFIQPATTRPHDGSTQKRRAHVVCTTPPGRPSVLASVR